MHYSIMCGLKSFKISLGPKIGAYLTIAII